MKLPQSTFKDVYTSAGEIKEISNPRFDGAYNGLVELDFLSKQPLWMRTTYATTGAIAAPILSVKPLVALIDLGTLFYPLSPMATGGDARLCLQSMKDHDVNDTAAQYLDTVTFSGQALNNLGRWDKYTVLREKLTFTVANTNPFPVLFVAYVEVGTCAVSTTGTFTGTDFGYPVAGEPYTDQHVQSNRYLKSLPNSKHWKLPAGKPIVSTAMDIRAGNMVDGTDDLSSQLHVKPSNTKIDLSIDVIDMLERLTAEELGASLDLQKLSADYKTTASSITRPSYKNGAKEGLTLVLMAVPYNQMVVDTAGTAATWSPTTDGADNVDAFRIANHNISGTRCVGLDIRINDLVVRKEVLMTDPVGLVNDVDANLDWHSYA